MAACKICKRTLAGYCNNHHLIPKEYGGKPVIKIHAVCHTMLHVVFSNLEMARYYHTPERIRENEFVLAFCEYLKSQYTDFSTDSNTIAKFFKSYLTTTHAK